MDRTLINQILRGIWVILVIAALAVGIYYSFPLLYPFVIGLFVAYIMNPFVNLMQRRGKFPRWLAVTVALLVYLGVSLSVISLLVTRIVVEIGVLLKTVNSNIDKWIEDLFNIVNSDFSQNIVDLIGKFYNDNPDYQSTINNSLSKTAKTIADAGTTIINFFFKSIVNLITALPSIATISIVILLATFFISKDWYRLITKISTWIPEQTLRTTRIIWKDLQKALFGYLRAQFILISITAIVVILGLLILDVNYAITIGLLIGLVDLLPYLGTGAVMVPWILYVFMYGNIPLGIGLSVLYGIILVARQIIEPKVLASSVGLDPLATLISMFIGLKLFGVLGLIVGPVSLLILTAFVKANVVRDLVQYIKRGRSI